VLDSTSLTGCDELASLVFTEENSQVVNDLVQALRDGTAPYRLLKEYFQESAKHFQDEKRFQKGSLLPGEVELMRQRWSRFVETLKPIMTEYSRLQGQIAGGLNIHKMPNLAREINKRNAEATEPSSTSTMVVTRKAITDVSNSVDAASKVNPPFSDPPVPVPWRRVWWQRIISCFKRNNSR
jgi:hypothetical protein